MKTNEKIVCTFFNMSGNAPKYFIIVIHYACCFEYDIKIYHDTHCRIPVDQASDVWYIVLTGLVKSKTIKLVFAISSLSTQYHGVRGKAV